MEFWSPHLASEENWQSSTKKMAEVQLFLQIFWKKLHHPGYEQITTFCRTSQGKQIIQVSQKGNVVPLSFDFHPLAATLLTEEWWLHAWCWWAAVGDHSAPSFSQADTGGRWAGPWFWHRVKPMWCSTMQLWSSWITGQYTVIRGFGRFRRLDLFFSKSSNTWVMWCYHVIWSPFYFRDSKSSFWSL